MKCIDELQKVGVEKIASKTRITQEKITNILNYKYEAFNKAHARGFTQIIEREFEVDMSEWMEALNNYHSEPKAQDELIKEIENIKVEKKDKSNVILVALLVAFVVIFGALFVYKNFIAESSVDSADLAVALSENGADLANDSTENDTDSAIDSANLTDFADISQNAESNANNKDSSLATLAQNDKVEADSANPATTTTIIIPAESTFNELTIIPNEPLWVGIIDLKTHKKQQFSIDKKRTITLDDDKIIRTGHSFFSIDAPNFKREFLGGDQKYLLYKTESGVTELTHKQFLELNKGEEW
ncbi:hypothetical protein ACWIUD_03870 [Helicobacter sp. 23-1044]